MPGSAKYPSKPPMPNEKYLRTSVNIYFAYLDKLYEISSAALPFVDADRILYELDIKLGNKIDDEA